MSGGTREEEEKKGGKGRERERGCRGVRSKTMEMISSSSSSYPSRLLSTP